MGPLATRYLTANCVPLMPISSVLVRIITDLSQKLASSFLSRKIIDVKQFYGYIASPQGASHVRWIPQRNNQSLFTLSIRGCDRNALLPFTTGNLRIFLV